MCFDETSATSWVNNEVAGMHYSYSGNVFDETSARSWVNIEVDVMQ
jgi:hypothetical protein